jgi:hypothetical protein
MSGCGAPARTARPISDRPSGVNVPGLDAAVQRQRAHELERQVMTSAGGVIVLMSLTIRPIPLVTIVPLSGFLGERGGEILQPGVVDDAWCDDTDLRRRFHLGADLPGVRQAEGSDQRQNSCAHGAIIGQWPDATSAPLRESTY